MTTSSSLIPPLSLIPDGCSRSFKDVIYGSSSSTPKLNFVHNSFKGYPGLMLDVSVVSQLAVLFALTLVGKFLLCRPNMVVIQKFFVSLKLSGAIHVGLLDPCHIAIQQSNDLDYISIFARRSYYIFKCVKSGFSN